MTVIDRIRAVTADEQGDSRPELGAAAGGALTALASWSLVVLVTVVAVLMAGGPLGSALGAGSAVWLGLGGARLGLGPGTIALVPLLALAAVVAAARLGARRTLDDATSSPFVDGGVRDQLTSPVLRRHLAWLGGYAAVALLAWAVSAAGPFAVRVPSVVLPALLVPLLGLALAQPRLLEPLADRLPVSLRRGLVPGLKGAAALLAVGSLLVVAMVVLHVSRVLHVHSELGAGVGGGLLLGALQALSLPNLALWGVSWLAGPGFSVSLGADTTWVESQTSLLPMVPVLAAHPDPGTFPWVVRAVVLVPVLAGAWVARSAILSLPRLARTSTKAAVAASAVAVSAVTLGVLDVVGGGSLGADRLADIGAPGLRLVLALLASMGVGALLVLARDWWRLRR